MWALTGEGLPITPVKRCRGIGFWFKALTDLQVPRQCTERNSMPARQFQAATEITNDPFAGAKTTDGCDAAAGG